MFLYGCRKTCLEYLETAENLVAINSQAMQGFDLNVLEIVINRWRYVSKNFIKP